MKKLVIFLSLILTFSLQGYAQTSFESISRTAVSETSIPSMKSYHRTDLRGKKLPAGTYNHKSFSFAIFDETSDISGCDFITCDFSYVIGLDIAKKDSNTKFSNKCNFTGAKGLPQAQYRDDTCIIKDLPESELITTFEAIK